MADERRTDERAYRAMLATVALGAGAVYLAYAVSPLVWLSESCAPDALGPGSLSFFAGFGTFMMMGVLTIALLVAVITAALGKANWRDVGWHALLLPLMFVGAWTSAGVSSAATAYKLESELSELDPLVDAIHAYEDVRGGPPPELAALVPDFLAEAPGTGMCAEHFELDYFPGESALVQHAWWDLGPYGETDGLMVHPYGESTNSLLVLTLRDGRIDKAYFDRKPADLKAMDFDMGLWHDEPEARRHMVKDFVANHVRIDDTLDSVTQVIGSADGLEGANTPGRWSLNIILWYDFIDPVYVEYNSDESYGVSGFDRRVGRWALVRSH